MSDNSADLDTRQKLAQQVFDTIIKANEHQDNKASRIIGSVSFLLAAGGAVLTFSLPTSGGNDRLQDLLKADYVLGVHPALFSFAVFVICVVIGVLLYLNALGPSFNWTRKKESQNINDPKASLLFFDEIGKHEPGRFIEHFSNSSVDDVKRQMIGNLAAESVLIAQKLRGKVAFLQVGSAFFRFGIPWLIPLLISNFSRPITVGTTLLTYALAISIPLFSTAWFEYKPLQTNKRSAWIWRTYLITGGLILIWGIWQAITKR